MVTLCDVGPLGLYRHGHLDEVEARIGQPEAGNVNVGGLGARCLQITAVSKLK